MTHTTEQPGLHAHSWDSENDLMKRFLVFEKTPLGYWLAIKSFDNYYGADDWLVFDRESQSVNINADPKFTQLSTSSDPEKEYKKVMTTGGLYEFSNGSVYKIVDQFA